MVFTLGIQKSLWKIETLNMSSRGSQMLYLAVSCFSHRFLLNIKCSINIQTHTQTVRRLFPNVDVQNLPNTQTQVTVSLISEVKSSVIVAVYCLYCACSPLCMCFSFLSHTNTDYIIQDKRLIRSDYHSLMGILCCHTESGRRFTSDGPLDVT